MRGKRNSALPVSFGFGGTGLSWGRPELPVISVFLLTCSIFFPLCHPQMNFRSSSDSVLALSRVIVNELEGIIVKDTYTFTARNSENPEKVVTFTLYGDHLRVNFTGLVEKTGKIFQSEEKPKEAGRQIASEAQPAALKVAQNISGPIHINDIRVNLVGDKFKLRAWQRLAGLRLIPLWVNIEHVDNIDAAQAFVGELRNRKEAAQHPGRFFGPLDFWAGWAGLLLGIAVLFRWPDLKSGLE